MDPLLLVGALALAAGLVPLFLGSRSSGKVLERDWATALEACGIGDVTTFSDGGARSLRARRGGLWIVLTPHGSGMRPGSLVAVSGLPSGLELRRRSFPSADRPRDLSDTAIGDAAFDEAIAVRTEPLLAHSFLDAETRRQLLALVLGHEELSRTGSRFVSLADGRLVATCPFAPIQTRAERLRVLLRALFVLCDRLTASGAGEQRVAENLRNEPLAAVRLRALGALAERPDHPVARAAVRAALADVDADVRWTAALAAGDEGFPLLRALASDPSTGDARAGRAIASLGTALDAAEAARILDEALRTNREKTAVACLQSPALTRMPQAEAVLVRALAHASAVVREEVVVALGGIGTAAAVAVLREAEAVERVRGVTARAAIAAIQARLVGADRGQLSVALDSGELSLAQDPDGRVTITGDE